MGPIYIPFEVVSESVLVMGDSTVRRLPKRLVLASIWRLWPETASYAVQDGFEDGFFHGDLHPGNLWVLADGRVGLIDFGLVGRMSQANKAMADLFLSIAMARITRLARTLYNIGTKRGPTDYAAFEADVFN